MTAAVIALLLLAALLALALVHHRRQLGRLRRWAAQPRMNDPPEAAGDWGEVFNLLHRHRRANLKRRRQLAQLIVRSRRAAQALPYGVTVLDRELRLDWCNDSARQHFDLHPERDRGAPIVNFLRHPDFVAYLQAREFSEPLRLQASGSSPRTLALQLVAFDEDAWLLLSQDVTAAERIEAMRRDFVANVSHELRTPLTVLVGFLETIQDLKLEPQRMRDYVNLMVPQAGRMRRLIDDLLALSALEHAPPPPEERIELRPLLERERNAVRYTPPGGEIRLAWRASGAGGEFTVEDTGIGIEAEHLPRLTERFYRVDRGRSRETGGTGLGLAIVKHALARHQAALEIASTPGKGSVFRARFPAARLLPAAQKVPG